MKKLIKRFSFPFTFWVQKDERSFLTFIIVAFLTAMFVTPYPQIAMWVGFLFAAYAAVANDSIQTLGTFIASNQDRKWWVLWIFIGGIFLITVGYSWLNYSGDVSHGRLLSKGFDKAPSEFHFLQIAAPVFLLILTRLRMPVSTTFILLTSFAAAPAAIGKVLAKSMSGYILAFFLGFFVFISVAKLAKKYFVGEAKLLGTPMGEIAKALIKDGGKLGVSSRGMGSLESKGGANYVKDDFYLATAADIVADPSAPQAFVEGIMEGKEWIWSNGILKEVEIAEIKEGIERDTRSRKANVEALALAKFLKSL